MNSAVIFHYAERALQMVVNIHNYRKFLKEKFNKISHPILGVLLSASKHSISYFIEDFKVPLCLD